MTRRRLFVDALAHLPVGEVAALEADEAHYVARVLRLGAGARVELVDGRGHLGEGELVDAGRAMAVRVLARRAVAVGRALTVAVSARKGPRATWMVEKLTELGVARIDWLVAERSQPHSLAMGPDVLARLTRLARAAARQSGCLHLPVWGPPQALGAWLAAGPAAQHGALWICHPVRTGPATPMQGQSRAVASAVLVGPEGGFTPEEVEAARAAGAQGLVLGPTILRVETAALVAAAYLQREGFRDGV